MKMSKQTMNAATVILGIALLILVGLAAYNYYLSGKFNFSIITTVGLILLVFIISRTYLTEK